MAKKKGVKSKTSTKTAIKKQKKPLPATKTTVSNADILKRLDSIDRKLNALPKLERKIFEEEEKIEGEEEAEIIELKKLEKLEKELENDVKVNPLTKIGLHDLTKSIIGAFFGVLGHFSFFYGVKLAENISMGRATLLYIIAFFIGFFLLYQSGFRKLDKKYWSYIPSRISIIYVNSIVVIFIVLVLFNYISFDSTFVEIYKTVASVSILAVMGAATADLLGRD